MTVILRGVGRSFSIRPVYFITILWGVCLLLLFSDPVHAVGISGRVSTVSYLYDPVNTYAAPKSDPNLDFLGRLTLDVRDLGAPAWSVFYMGTANGEVLHDGLSGLNNRVYRGYLQYLPSRTLKVQAGRVWANAGVATSRVDGARILWRGRPGSLSLIGGTRGFNDPHGETVHSLNADGWDHSGWVGVSYRSPSVARIIRLNASWSRSMWEGREESERVGFAVSCRPDHRWGFFYENRYELNQKVPYYQHLRGSYRFNSGSLSLAYNRRDGHDPALDDSYIFRRFRFEPWFHEAADRVVQEVRGHLLLQPDRWRGWRVAADVVEVYPDGQQNSDGVDVSLGKGLLRVGYRGLRGYRGLQDGFYGNLSWRVRPDTRLWLDANRVSYRYYYEGLPGNDLDRDVVAATVVGVDRSLPRDWFVSGSLEFLDYPGVSYDIRARLQVAYRFSLGNTDREVW